MSTTTIAASPFAEELSRCRSQQRLWSLQTVRQRLGPVRAFRRLLVEECDRLAAIIPAYLRWAIEAQRHRDLKLIGEHGAENVFALYRREVVPTDAIERIGGEQAAQSRCVCGSVRCHPASLTVKKR